MSAMANGLRRGTMELKLLGRSSKDVSGYLFTIVMFVMVANWQHGRAQLVISGGIASLSVMIALTSLPQALATDKQDGTLLRVRGIPSGTTAYVVGKVLYITVVALVSSVLLLFAGAAVNHTGLPEGAQAWLTLAWVLVLGFAATAPLGLIIGAVLPNPREALALVMLPVYGLLGISGVFFPFSSLPGWLQTVAEVFPLKWMAQGVRSALMPETVAAEVGHSWQHPQAAAVLAVWVVAGTVVAAQVLRRTTRRESGSALSERRETTMARGR